MSNKPLMMSWNDRFALIDHYAPADTAVCAAFNLTQDELDTARTLRAAGTFSSNPNVDFARYKNVFVNVAPAAPSPVETSTSRIVGLGSPDPYPITKEQIDRGDSAYGVKGSATIHTKPETASKRPKVPQKRGRKGDKIIKALTSIPTTPVSIEGFMEEYGVSLAVLRQSKRFIEKLEPAIQAQIGRVNVRQDKQTKKLMIWREAL